MDKRIEVSNPYFSISISVNSNDVISSVMIGYIGNTRELSNQEIKYFYDIFRELAKFLLREK